MRVCSDDSEEKKLTLARLAERLDTTSNRVSQTLNEGRGLTFGAALAQHRVQKSQRILVDPANAEKPVIDIALESGFNDRRTFYRQFKRTDKHPLPIVPHS